MKNRRFDLWKRITAIGLVAVLCLSGEGTTSLAAKKTESANESIESATAKTIQLAKTEGKVSVSNASGKGVTVIKNMRLLDGYKVTTEKESYAWAELDKAKLIKADAVSEVSVRKNKKILEVFLESGNMFFNVTEPLSDDETMNICTSSMIAGIRGTCGWVRVINKMCTRIYLLEGKLECTVIDPVTGQAKMILLKAGEWADFYVYDKDHKGDKCDIIQDRFVREDVPGFVLVELVGDNKRCEEIFQDSGIDLRNLTKAEAAQRLAEDEEATEQKLASIEAVAMLLASHISQDPVWVSDPDRPILVSNPAKPAQTPVVTPAPAETPAETPVSTVTPAAPAETPTTPVAPEEKPNTVQNVDVQENPDVVEELLAEGNDVTVASDPTSNIYQIDSDLTIPAGTTMTVEEDLTLVVGSAATVTVDGTLLAMGNVENNGKIIINSGESVHVDGDLANHGIIINQKKGRMEVKDGIDNYGDIVCDGESTMYSSSPEGTVRMISDSSTLVISGGDITNESDGAALALEEASQIGNVTFTTQTLLQSVSENVLTVGGKQLTVDRFDVSKNDSEYYQFKIEIKNVSFQPNGGNLSKNVKVITGFPVGSGMPAPTRAGYELTGWNTEADGSGTEFTKDTIVDENIIVYAQWKETTVEHTITFNGNGGTLSGSTTVTVLRNGKVTLPTPTAPTGYAFYGWYTAADSTGVKITGSEPITADGTYYARWVPATAAATVTFQINDGSGATTAIQSVAVGNIVSEPPTPAREGYTFGGWYTDQDCTNAYDFSKPLTASTFFYAKWDINNYPVTFDTGSGGSSVASQGVDYNHTVTMPPAPTKTGYTFDGWYKDAALTESWNFNADTVTGATTVYAKWNINNYIVSFDTGAGGSEVADQGVDYDHTMTMPPTPTKKGYTFAGWYKDTALTESWDFGTDTVTEATTLYASWTINRYTVNFDTGAGGSAVADQGVDYDHTTTMPPTPTRTGYTFAGWYADADLTRTWDFGTDTVTEDTTIYAKWDINSYTVSFDTGAGGSAVADQGVDYDHTMTAPTAPTKTGYTFAGWYKDAALTNEWDFAVDTVTDATTLYAKWTINTYTVSFDTGAGGSAVADQGVDYDHTMTAPVTPTKTGYTFAGWYKDAALTESWDFTNDTVTGATTLYAKWTINTYTVSFHTGDGGSAVASQGVDYDHTMTAPVTPTRTGYTFAGWYKDAAFTDVWDFTTDTVTEDTTVYAKWDINSYTLNFDANGGSSVASQSVNYQGKATVPTAPTRTGYTFAGWYRDTALTSAWDFTNDTVTGTTTLYAKWDINSYTVAFDTDGGSAVAGQTVEYRAKATEPSAPTRTGYTFAGWYADAALKTAWDFGADAVTADTTIYAKWNINHYTVAFEVNGGSVVADQSVEYNKTATKPADPAKTGYTFAGWYKEAALTNAWDFGADAVTADTTLYAKWTVNRYSVTFNANGGSAVAGQTVDYNGKATAPTAPTKTGYTFDGWYQEATLTNAWNFGTDTVTADTTLYAKWEAISYTVQFYTNGGSTVADQTVKYDEKATKPADPTKTGYTFGGWYKETALTNVWDFTTDTIAGDTTLYARWNVNLYTVTFNANGGSTVAPQDVNYNEKATEPTTPTRTGYAFAGWYKEAALTNAWDFTTDVVTGNTDLYARWNVNSYTVTFDVNGGSAVADQGVDYNEKATAPTTPTKTGYTFGGWYKEAALTTAWDFTADVVTGDTTIYAKWEKKEYTVTFNVDSGSAVTAQTVKYEEKATKPADPTKTGYLFDGWYKESTFTTAWDFTTDVVTGDTTIYAKWNINRYTVTFETNGGSSVTSQSVNYQEKATEPTAPTRTGYDFAGWYRDSALTGAWNFATDTVTAATTLYAKWEKKEYTVTFNVDGGSAVTAQTVKYEEKATKPADPTKTGYLFDGWYKESTFATAWDFTADVVTGDTTIYAKWNINSYTLTFSTGAGASTIAPVSVEYNAKATAPTAPTKTGYTFVGWYKEATLTTAWDFTADVVTGDTTIYAKWNINTYTVAFDVDGGSTVADQSVKYDEKAAKPTDPTKTGYTFGGWYKEATLTNAWDFTADVVTGDTTIYAKWEKKEYTVTFNVDGGSAVTAQTVKYEEKATKPADPTKTGYLFDGWYKEPTFATAWDFDADQVTGNTTIYAKWTINSYTVTFETNGGSSVASQSVNYQEKATEPTAPTRTGYDFAGWYRDSALTGAWNFATDTVTAATTLYAKWEKKEYTVTFNVDGGSAVTAQTVKYEEKATKPADPTKTGYLFDGWYKEETLATAWDFDADKVTGNTTIYAKWKVNKYTVTFDAGTGASTVDPASVEYNKTVTKPTDPTRTGYTFGGWYKEETLATAWDFAADKVTAATTLYAKWTINTYTVTFDVDGGSAVTAQTVKYEEKATKPTDPTKAGYVFDGWYKETGLENEWDFAADTVKGDMTLYAKWMPKLGDFAVSGGVFQTDYDYDENEHVLNILTAEKLTIRNVDPATATTDRIEVAAGVSADITLAGVNIDTSSLASAGSTTEIVPLSLSSAAGETIKITLAAGRTNTLKGAEKGMQDTGSGTLSIVGATTGALTVTGSDYGIYAYNAQVCVTGGALSVSTDATSLTYGIYCNTFTSKDADVTVDVKSNGKSAFGIRTNTVSGVTGAVAIDGGTMSVNAESTSAGWDSYGIYTPKLTISGTTERVEGNASLTNGNSRGIYVEGSSEDMFIVSADSVEIVGTGSEAGIYVRSGKFSVTGEHAKISATGKSYGLYIDGAGVFEFNGDTLRAVATKTESYPYGIRAGSATITFGENTKSVYAEGYIYGIDAKALTIKGGEITATSTEPSTSNNRNYGINIEYGGHLQIEGSSTVVNASATGRSGYGIYSNGDLVIDGSTVTAIASADDSSSYGIYADYGTEFMVKGGTANVTAKGGGYGIRSYIPVIVDGGTVTAAYTGTGYSGYGIYGNRTVTIGQNVKKVVANGYSYGIYASSGIQIAGGEVEATAIDTGTYSYGIYSYSPVVISGGSVSAQAGQYAVYGGTVTMTGGEVTATASNSGNTIYGSSGSVISGGVIRVNYDEAAGGNAFNSSVSVQPGANGLIVFENGAGKVYGDTVLAGDFEVASAETLALTKDPSGPDVSLTVPEGLTMTNNGVVTIGLETQLIVDGLLINNGVINNSGVALSDPKDWADVYSGTGEWRGTPGGVVPSYTVTFQENGGNTVNPQTRKFGEKATKPDDPAKTGFIFDGWYVDEACLTEYDFDTPVRKNIILYARWADLSYTVTFDANGGTFTGASTTSTQVVDYGKKVKELASEDLPVKTGYLVEGWYKDAACTEEYDFNTLVKRETTIYAKWKIQTFTVTFVDASNVLEEETVNYNEKATVPTEPTKAGYLFANWCEDSACTKPYDFQTAVTKNLTLYANWAKLTGSIAVAGGVEGVDYEYDSVNQILNIKSTKTLTLLNEDASTAAADRIQVEPGVAANIILAGVNIDVSGVAISASSSAGSSVNITLASGTTNILNGSVGLQDTGSGALNIGGNGTLDTTGTTYGIEAPGIHVNGGILFVNGGTAAGSSAITVNPASSSGAVVFENETGRVYGDLTLDQDLVIAAGQTLIVPNGVTLTIAGGKTLTNNGAVIVENGGTLSGTVVDNGTMMDNGAVSCGASASGQSALAPYRGDITSVVFKSGVTSISANCFENCTGLTSVEIPSGVTTIGASAFAGCTGLTSAEIPSTVTTINASAFAGCTNLTKVSSLYNVDYIRDYAFKDCNSLVGVIIPTYTGATVGTGVFPETTELYYGKTSGNRKPSWVSNYSSNPFFFMESTSATNTYWNYTNGVLTIAGTGKMGNYTSSTYTNAPWNTYKTSITSVVIREGVTSVGNYAFPYVYSALENVTLADSITSIGESAFSSCSKITNITIPEGVTSIGASAFSSCSGLTSVTIPGSVTSIGEYAFKNCSKLTGVTIPEGVTSIGASAFYYCSGLTSVTIPSSVTSMGTKVFEGCSGLTSVTITEGATTVWETAFYNCSKLTSVTIPDSVTSIGASAFYGCSKLTSVTIPDGVTSIGASAFYGCRGLTGITIPNGVTSIGASAFENCSGLTGGITIPKGVTSIGASAFYGCSGLTGVWLEDGIQINEIGACWFSGCSKITEFCYSSEAGTGKFAIPATVTTIGAGAFSECESLTGTLDIPDGVVSIGNNAFRGMKGITGVVIPSGTTLGKNLFYGTPLETAEFKSGRTEIPEGLFKRYNASNYVTQDTYLKTVILPDTIQIIGKEAFYQNTALTSITLPDGVTTIGDHAFYNCSLEELTIPSSVTTIGKNAFEWNKNLTTLTVGSEQIGEKAFQNCDALTSITFLDTVRSIGTSAFEKLANNPSGALTIDFGHGVQTIGDRAFCNRRTMTSLTIPASVTSIGDDAFYSPYSTALTELVIEEGENPLTIGNDAFYNSTNLASLVLPDRVTSIGNSAFRQDAGGMLLTDLTIGSGLTSLPANAFDTSKLTYIKWRYLDSGSGEVTEYIYETDAASSAFEKFRAEYIAKGCTMN